MVQINVKALACKKTSTFKVTSKVNLHARPRAEAAVLRLPVLAHDPDKPSEDGACSTSTWQLLEEQSRDGCVSFSTRGYYAASMDQTCPSLNTATACSMLSLTIARWLHLVNQGAGAAVDAGRRLPSPATLDRLLLEGSRRWRRFLSLSQVKEMSRSDGLQELDTALRHSHMGVRADDAHSFVAFFQPPLPTDAEAMSEAGIPCEALGFDSVWDSLVSEAATQSKQGITYVVGWNAHYFVLYIPPGSAAFYVVDTLGQRLSSSCEKAYILKLDSSSTAAGRKMKSGAEACRVFLRDFMAGAAVKEVVADYRKGLVSQQKLLETLQIDFRAVHVVLS